MEDIQKIDDLIGDIKVAMLVTKGSQGELHSRPMATQKIDDEGNLWFFISISSLKSIEVSQEKHVNLIYTKPDCYASVVGTATITQDPEKMRSLWHPMFKAWFPLGLEDEELALLKVKIDYVEYWKTPGGASTKLVDFAKSMVMGDTKNMGEHGVLHA